CQVLQRVIRGLEDVRIHGERADVGEHQRVAVGRGLGDVIDRDIAARARAVLDYHLLAEQLTERRRDDARRRVGAAAGLEAHDAQAEASYSLAETSRMMRFATPMVSGAFAVIMSQYSRIVFSSSATGTTLCTRPMWLASSAVN